VKKKKAYTLEKCKNSTSGSLGFRICGLQAYNKPDGTVRKWGKQEGLQLTATNIAIAIKSFYFDGITYRKDVMKYHLDKLQEIYNAFKDNKTWVLVSSSLLLVYDSGPILKADVRVIDFANTVRINVFENLSDQVEYETGVANLIIEYTKAYNSTNDN